MNARIKKQVHDTSFAEKIFFAHNAKLIDELVSFAKKFAKEHFGIELNIQYLNVVETELKDKAMAYVSRNEKESLYINPERLQSKEKDFFVATMLHEIGHLIDFQMPTIQGRQDVILEVGKRIPKNDKFSEYCLNEDEIVARVIEANLLKAYYLDWTEEKFDQFKSYKKKVEFWYEEDFELLLSKLKRR